MDSSRIGNIQKDIATGSSRGSSARKTLALSGRSYVFEFTSLTFGSRRLV